MRFLLHHWPVFVPFLVGQFGFDFGDLTAILESYLADLVSFLLAAVQFIWSALVFVANYLWKALNFLFSLMVSLFQQIKAAFKWIWDNVIKGGLTKLIALYAKIRAWLHDTLGPIIDIIKKIRKWYDDVFNRWFKPILRVLQTIRKVLTIFRLLGFKWAKRLDGDIAAIEQKIAQAYTTLRSYLNLAITWLDLIIDPGGILRRNPLLKALFLGQNELRNLVLGAAIRPLTSAEIDQQAKDRAQASKATQQSNFQNYYAQKQLTPDDDVFRDQFNKEYSALRGGGEEPSF